MEYPKITNLFENKASNQPSKFRTKNWAEINNESREGYATGNDVKFKTAMTRSILCGYADAYILVKRTIAINLFEKTLILRRSTVAIFADIIKIVTKFIKTIIKDPRKVKRIRNYVSKSNLYLYFLV